MGPGRILSVSLAVAICAGCAAKPRVNSTFFGGETPPAGLSDSYAFPKTFVEIKPAKSDALVDVSARNQTFEEFRVGLSRNDSWGVRTLVSVTKVANSDMVDEIGVETKDQRIAVVEGVGKLITTVLPFAFSAGPCGAKSDNLPLIATPVSLDSLAVMRGCGIVGTAGTDGADEGWRHYKGLNVWFGPLPPGSRPVRQDTGFVSLAGKDFERSIVYAACREMRLEMSVPDMAKGGPQTGKVVSEPVPAKVVRSIYVADPRFFRTVSLPYKGKVKIHPQCGTSTTTDANAAPSTDLAVITAIAAQAAAVQAAVEKEKKAGDNN